MSGIRYVGAAFRSDGSRIYDQRALVHFPRRRNERRHTSGVRMLRMTAHARLNYVLAAFSQLRAHRAVGATEHATTSHPEGDADR